MAIGDFWTTWDWVRKAEFLFYRCRDSRRTTYITVFISMVAWYFNCVCASWLTVGTTFPNKVIRQMMKMPSLMGCNIIVRTAAWKYNLAWTSRFKLVLGYGILNPWMKFLGLNYLCVNGYSKSVLTHKYMYFMLICLYLWMNKCCVCIGNM